ncbi:hypothetical protein PTTG_02118 [Puccinia triticina 1-1 BBBD Race 1]|uniref:Uncharacterized protein n=2 Tax=Puccinia triticina TaxID=208348 RepID=A0A0C4EMX8_PUCT1|nr:uncharacterized protein PtA15_5A260 [Puccinia triticina]OAV96094.1 hypothetical protein PTTG_02118 [Puccinia triticina 1-1 BBBD Race 1]WAQ84687.1 hypothetical protein PtA15_5A260 [Puccinia triticina]WAR58031.1 hypothetical protein PtB15_5B262 [Puccinia triticina]
MERSLTSRSSYFFFPDYEDHFPEDPNKREESIPFPDSPTYDAKFTRPVPWVRFKHPSSPPGDLSGNREAEADLILRYLYEATQGSNLNQLSDDFSKPSSSSMSSSFPNHSARLPLVTYLKKLWRSS